MCFSVTHAFEVEILVERTGVAPGFFAVTILPSNTGKTFNLKNIYVKNFSEIESPKYRNLIPFISEVGGVVIDSPQLSDYIAEPFVRLVGLGEEKDLGLDHYFSAQSEKQILEDFDNFVTETYKPVYLLDLEFKHSDNIQNIYPPSLHFLTDEPLRLLGRFDEAKSTKIEILAQSPDGQMKATVPIDLESDYNIKEYHELPEEWEALSQNKPFSPKLKKHQDTRLLGLFPWILAVIGLGVVVWVLFFKKEEISRDKSVAQYLDELDRERQKDSALFEEKD